jgi:hypothetical protein
MRRSSKHYLTCDRHIAAARVSSHVRETAWTPAATVATRSLYVKSWLVEHRSANDTRTRLAAPKCVDALKNLDSFWTILICALLLVVV